MQIVKKSSKKTQTLIFPVHWKPYPYQVPLWNYLNSGGRRAVAIWHRRAGKDLLGINWITAAALKSVGVYWYIFPTYDQAKRTIWDGVTLDGRSYLSYILESLVASKRAADLRIELKNGSIIQFVGSTSPDSLRGSGIKGAVLSEYSYQNPITFLSVIQPMIVRSQGWLLFLYTPSDDPSQLHGHELYQNSVKSEGFFTQCLSIDDTVDDQGKPLVTLEQLEDLRKCGMTEAQLRREFYCDFEAHKYRDSHSTFSVQLRSAEQEGRIGIVPYDSAHKVNTYWDMGIVDYTAIWFVQELQDSIHLIDFYINRGKDFKHYLEWLRLRPYTYGRNVLPHDMKRRQLPTLDTRLDQCNEIAKAMNFEPFEVAPKYEREQMIGKARELLMSCRIDAVKCRDGIEGLYEFDATKRTTHSASMRCTDISEAFCYLAMDTKTSKEREDEQTFHNHPSHAQTVNDYAIFG